ncbi:Transmembrane protein 237 [Nymphon striatum]|nr:Transmembrane protein 237 [Nymphon striatum]
MAGGINGESITTFPVKPERPARELPPLSPRKVSKDKKPTEIRKKRRKSTKLSEENGSSDRYENIQLQNSGKVNSNDTTDSTSQKAKPVLPPRSPRRKSSTSNINQELNDPSPTNDDTRKSNRKFNTKTKSKSEKYEDGNTRKRNPSLNSNDSHTIPISPNKDADDSEISPRLKQKNVHKKKRNSTGTQSQISASQQELITPSPNYVSDDDLVDLDDDIKEVEPDKPPIIDISYVDSVPVQSQQINKCFIEHKDLFKPVDKKALMNIIQQRNSVGDSIIESRPAKSALQLAQSSHNSFKTFTLFCHGLLAGISLWQIIVTYNLSDPHHSLEDFLDHYSFISQPMQSVFSFLLAVCIVSVFDRYEFGRLDLNLLKDIFTFRHGAFVIIIYLSTFVLNLSIHDIDDNISLYAYNSSWWSSFESENNIGILIHRWKIANLCRCIGAIIGWMMIAFYPHVDYMSKILSSLSEKEKNNSKTSIMTIA